MIIIGAGTMNRDLSKIQGSLMNNTSSNVLTQFLDVVSSSQYMERDLEQVISVMTKEMQIHTYTTKSITAGNTSRTSM